MKNQPEERLATTSEQNLASTLAGNNREEAGGMGYEFYATIISNYCA
jgi:hypothetical protein